MVPARIRHMRGRAFGTLACLAVVAVVAFGRAGFWYLAPASHISSAEVQASETTRTDFTTWDATSSPDYYRVVGAAVVDEDVDAGVVSYAPLDSLGRAGRAVARVTSSMVEAGVARKRESMEDILPSGWGHNEKVDIDLPDGSTYHGYLFNRSHLIAKSLGGSEVVENLITGTRTQNVGANDGRGGMAYPETLVRNWLRDNSEGSVWYSATPVYEGDELVPRSVIVDLRSSDGSLDLELEVYNAAQGYRIDYSDGTFSRV